MSSVTTVKSGFRVEDITFKNARRQSAIENECSEEEIVSNEVQAPISLTPEQVKKFIRSKSEGTQNMQERKVYNQILRWIDELLETRKQLINLKSKEEVKEKVNEEVGDI